MDGDSPRKDLRVFFLVTACLMVLGFIAAIVMVSRVEPVAAKTSPTTSTSLSIQTAAPRVKPLATPSSPAATSLTEPTEEAELTVAPDIPVEIPPASAPDVPAFAPVAPAPVRPVVPRTTPSCPADQGVVLTLDSAQMVSEGSALDSYSMTLTLDNRQSVPVSLRTLELLGITGVRANGAEMSSGSFTLPNIYDIQPGRTSFTLERPNQMTTFHGFGSPVVAFKLSGQVTVTNSTPDINANSRFCPFDDVVLGPALRGYWGS